MKKLTGLNKSELVGCLGIHRSKFTSWEKRFGLLNQHNSKVPKQNLITPQEYAAIVEYAKKSESISTIYSKNGYKKLTYTMIDENIAFVSPSTAYRVLKREGLLNKWTPKTSKKGDGYKQLRLLIKSGIWISTEAGKELQF